MSTAPTPDAAVWLVAGYAVALLAVAWLVDALGSRSARRTLGWRHADFVYHDDVDGWRCHEDQWLWPTAFDPDKRVIRYAGAHAVCGRCPAKASCSPTPGPREITRPVDPWPYSEAGRFHRGIALAIACVGLFLDIAMMLGAHGPLDLVVLATTAVVLVAGTLPLARHLWHTPDNAPEALPHIGSAEETAEQERRAGSAAPSGGTGRYSTSARARQPVGTGGPGEEPVLQRVSRLTTRDRLARAVDGVDTADPAVPPPARGTSTYRSQRAAAASTPPPGAVSRRTRSSFPRKDLP